MLNAIKEKLTSLLRNKPNPQYCTNLFVRHDLKHAIIKTAFKIFINFHKTYYSFRSCPIWQ